MLSDDRVIDIRDSRKLPLSRARTILGLQKKQDAVKMLAQLQVSGKVYVSEPRSLVKMRR